MTHPDQKNPFLPSAPDDPRPTPASPGQSEVLAPSAGANEAPNPGQPRTQDTSSANAPRLSLGMRLLGLFFAALAALATLLLLNGLLTVIGRMNQSDPPTAYLAGMLIGSMLMVCAPAFASYLCFTSAGRKERRKELYRH